jgi:nicotinic acid phosphoribosyltransferase
METRILRLEDEFWRIRTDTGELADAERNALRAYLDEKGFKTAIIDDNLAIAGELTWQEIVEPVEAFYEGKADVYPF